MTMTRELPILPKCPKCGFEPCWLNPPKGRGFVLRCACTELASTTTVTDAEHTEVQHMRVFRCKCNVVRKWREYVKENSDG